MDYDIFNGDADGICALHQLRLAEPRPQAVLVTGVKRDIKLLARLQGETSPGDRLTVLDVSMDSNREALLQLLADGCEIMYVDHHFSGDIPDLVTAHIDPDSEICTSLIVDRLLGGKYRAWAVVAAFGDNLHDSAWQAAASLDLAEDDLAILRELGELLNYNGYGGGVSDLHFPPDELYMAIAPFADPFEFYKASSAMHRLRNGFAEDMSNAAGLAVFEENQTGRIYKFPAETWSKRVAGVFSNERAREKPDLAHALLVDNGDNSFMVSVRAPLNNKKGADTLCRAFPTGGGRTAAAGINALPENMLDVFVGKFTEIFAT